MLTAETDRLERLARDFADLGRMPEGPASEVDVTELLGELARTAVPPGVTVAVRADARRAVQGHYEPLRRAFANLLRNAAEAMGGRGAIDPLYRLDHLRVKTSPVMSWPLCRVTAWQGCG